MLDVISYMKLLGKQGDQMSFQNNRPKCSPTHFCQKSKTLTVQKGGSPKMRATSEIFKKCPKKTITQ
jgi:hypothetical protein